MEMKIEGLAGLMEKLEYLGGNSTQAINKGLGKAAQKIKADAKRFCPYDTGRLKGSISSEHTGPMEWAVGTNVEYAPYVEFGTGSLGDPSVPHTTKKFWRYKKKGKYYTTHGQPPKPFLYPALLYNKDYVFKSAKLQLAKALRGKMNGD